MTNGERKVKRAGICVCISKQEAASAGQNCSRRQQVQGGGSRGAQRRRDRVDRGATAASAQLTAAPECSPASALLLRPTDPGLDCHHCYRWVALTASQATAVLQHQLHSIDLSARVAERAEQRHHQWLHGMHACFASARVRARRSIHSRAGPDNGAGHPVMSYHEEPTDDAPLRLLSFVLPRRRPQPESMNALVCAWCLSPRD
jgi:hypothetical protein